MQLIGSICCCGSNLDISTTSIFNIETGELEGYLDLEYDLPIITDKFLVGGTLHDGHRVIPTDFILNYQTQFTFTSLFTDEEIPRDNTISQFTLMGVESSTNVPFQIFTSRLPGAIPISDKNESLNYYNKTYIIDYYYRFDYPSNAMDAKELFPINTCGSKYVPPVENFNKDLIHASGNYGIFSKTNSVISFVNPNNKLATLTNLDYLIKRLGIGVIIQGLPVTLTIDFSGKIGDTYINFNEQVSCTSFTETKQSFLQKLNNLHPLVKFTTKHTTYAIQQNNLGGYRMDYDVEFNGIYVLNVKSSSGHPYKSCEEPYFMFTLTNEQIQQTKQGVPLVLHLKNRKFYKQFNPDLFKEIDNIFYIPINYFSAFFGHISLFELKLALTVGDANVIFRDDNTREFYGIDFACDFSFYKLNSNGSNGQFAIVIGETVNLSTGWVDIGKTFNHQYLKHESNTNDPTMYITRYFDNIQIFNNHRSLDNKTKWQFAKIENNVVVGKQPYGYPNDPNPVTIPINGFENPFSDVQENVKILEHSNGNLYLSGYRSYYQRLGQDSNETAFVFPDTSQNYYDPNYYTSSIVARSDRPNTPLDLNKIRKQIPTYLFKLNKSTMEIVKATTTQNYTLAYESMYHTLRSYYRTDNSFLRLYDFFGEFFDGVILNDNVFDSDLNFVERLPTHLNLFGFGKFFKTHGEYIYLLHYNHLIKYTKQYQIAHQVILKEITTTQITFFDIIDNNIYICNLNNDNAYVYKYTLDGELIYRTRDPYFLNIPSSYTKLFKQGNQLYATGKRLYRKLNLPEYSLTITDSLRFVDENVGKR